MQVVQEQQLELQEVIILTVVVEAVDLKIITLELGVQEVVDLIPQVLQTLVVVEGVDLELLWLLVLLEVQELLL